MLNRKLVKVAVVSATTGAALSAGISLIVIGHYRRRLRRQFLSKGKRKAITKVIELAADEVMPDGIVASSLLRHHLNRASDKELLAIYGVAKAGEYMREAGINPLQASTEQVERVRQRFNLAQNDRARGREALLNALLAHGFEELKPMLSEALVVLDRED